MVDELLSDVDARSIRIAGRLSYATPTDVHTMAEAERLLRVWREMASLGGRYSRDAGEMYRNRIEPLLANIVRTRWDWANESRWPMLVSAILRKLESGGNNMTIQKDQRQ